MNTATLIYLKAQVVLNNGTKLPSGEIGPSEFFKREIDYDKLAEVWKKWRDVSGKKIRPYYKEKKKLENQRAKANGT